MSFDRLANVLERINIFEETTMTDISYLPSRIGKVKAAIASLAKKKKEWNIEILDDGTLKEVKFEDELSIGVPKGHWNHFTTMFDGKIDNNAYLNLNTILNEEMEEELSALQKNIKPETNRAFTNPPFDSLEEDINRWKNYFGAKQYKKQDVVVSYNNKKEDLKRLVYKIMRVYRKDRGNLQMILGAFKEKDPLSSFVPFKDSSFVYGTKIKSIHEGIVMFFEGTIDSYFEINESVTIKDQAVLDEMDSISEGFEINDSIIYPKGKRFNEDFFETLEDAIYDADIEMSKEDKEIKKA